jgi:hypothetical protein
MYMGFLAMKDNPRRQSVQLCLRGKLTRRTNQATGSRTVTPQSTRIVWAVTPVASQAR